MKVAVYNQKGKKTEDTVVLAEEVFKAELNSELITQALYVYQSNQRQGTRKTKSRGDVSGGGKKPWKQKTPGKARQSSIRSPLWVGGGHAHAIDPTEWRLRLPIKMRRGAISSALSDKLANDGLKFVDSVKISEEKRTNQVEALYKAFVKDGSLLVITNETEKDLYLGSRSLDNVKVIRVGEINIFDVVKYDSIVMLNDAALRLSETWAKKKAVSK